MIEKIERYFDSFDFDIRKTKNARFLDQKVTPDILTIISDCVIEFLNQTGKNRFTSKDIWNFQYSNENIQEIFNLLKREYENFIIANTAINGTTEVRRIFTKVLNPLAFKYKKFGTRKGYISTTPITLDELYYNRVNWRDIEKSKNETREEFNLSHKIDNKSIAYHKYSLQKAKKLIKKYHSPSSEVEDEFSYGEATQVHHIFMQSEFPTIDSYLENLILLTPTQHFTKAHPQNNTKIIDIEYQKICLEAKYQSIQKFPDLYSLEDFEYVMKIGYRRN